MAIKKISEFPDLPSALQSADYALIERGGAGYKKDGAGLVADVSADVLSDFTTITDPLVDFRTWDSSNTYGLNDPTFYDGIPYRSLQAGNTNKTPGTEPLWWEVTGGGASSIGNIAPDPTGAKGNSDWTESSATVTTESTTLTGFATELKIFTAGAGSAYQTIAVPVQLRGEEIEVRFEGIIQTGTPSIAFKNQAGTILPSVGTLPATTGKFTFVGRLYTSSDTTAIRMEITASGAIELRLTSIYVGRPQTVYGAAISSDYSYNPWDADHVGNTQGFGTATAIDFKWHREGSYVVIQGKFTTGTTTASEARIALPKGLTSIATIPTLQSAQGFLSRGSTGFLHNCNIEPSKSYIVFGSSDSTNTGLSKRNANDIIGNTVLASLFAKIPISEWTGSGTVELASQAGPLWLSNTESVANTNGVVGKSYYGIDGSPILANTAETYYDITLPRALLPDETPKIEVRSKVDGNWIPIEIASVPSLFITALGGGIAQISTSTTYLRTIIAAKISANTIRVQFPKAPLGSTAWEGGTVTSRTWATTIAAADGYDRWRVRIEKAGSAREQAPKVYATMFLSSNQSVTLNNPIPYSTISEDSHGCLTTGASAKFTCKVPGRYKVTMAGAASGSTLYKVYKNGTAFALIGSSSAGDKVLNASMEIQLALNDYIDIRSDPTTTQNGSATLATTSNWIQVSGPF